MKQMMNKAKFLELVSATESKTETQNNWRIANRRWLKASQTIAFDILERLDHLSWTQKDLAQKMGVSPQYIHKLVKGSENLTLETLTKLQEILEIPLLASYFKGIPQNHKIFIFNFEQKTENYSVIPVFENKYLSNKGIAPATHTFSTHYSYSEIIS
jgi:transcriptional regulator with XRE-family HTH domain